MNNIIYLIKANIINAFGNKGKGGLALVFTLLLFAGLMVYYSFMLMMTLAYDQYYLVLYTMALAGIMFLIINDVILAKGYLIGFKDYDFLMSLPISKKDIFISKMGSFLVLSLIYFASLVIPSMLVYGIMANKDLVFYLFMIIGFVFQPLLVMALSGILALIIEKISGHGKYRDLISNSLNVIFFIIVMFFSLKISMNANNIDFGATLMQIKDLMQRYTVPLYLYINACNTGNIINLIISVGINVIAFVLFIFLFDKIFIRINQDSKIGFSTSKYESKKLANNSILITLIKKEAKTFFTNFQYVFNLSIGTIMMIIAAVYMVINKDILHEYLNMFLPEFNEMIKYEILLIVGLFSQMDCISCVSISLEGKNLWILKTLPIKAKDVFIAKMATNFLVIAIPGLFTLLLVYLVFSFGILTIISSIIYVILMALFVSMYGLVVNLAFPKLVWEKEISVIKQSASSLISILTLMALSFGVMLIFGYFGSSIGYDICFVFIVLGYLLMDIILYVILIKWGVNKYIALSI